MPTLPEIRIPMPEEEQPLTLYARITNANEPPKYDDIMNSNLPREEKARQIQYRTQAYQDDLDRQLHKDYARIGLGGLVSAVGALPIAITKNPVIGSAIGGGVYELGQGIMEGDEFPELMQRSGFGAAIGGAAGGVVSKAPQAAKFVDNLSGGKIGNALKPIGEKITNSKLYDALMTDIRGNWIKGYHGTPYTGKINRFKYDPTKQTGTDFGEAYYFTNDFDNASGYGYDVTKDIDIIKLQDERKNIISKGLDAFENGDMQTYYETQKMLKNNSKNIQDAINTGRHNKTGGQVIKANLDFKNPYIADAQGANYFDVYPNYFKNAREGGYDSIIARNVLDSSKTGLKPSDTYIAFSPDQIHQINQPDLYQQLAGKQNTGASSSSLYDYLSNAKANQQYEQELQKLYNPPNNIDPNTIRAYIGDVSDDAYNLGLQNGYDLTGFQHMLDNSGFNHFRNNHFGINEVDDRLIPLSDDDIRNIPNIIYSPDTIEFLPKTVRKLPRIKYTKNTNNGKQIYVEQIQNKKKRLNTKTMWKEK